MLRVVLVLLWIAVTVYAIADWWRTPEERCPGRIPKALWLLLILLTIPSFSIGSIAWVILRAVARAEARQRGEIIDDEGLFSNMRERMTPTAAPSAPAPVAPDDDPEFLFRLERDLARKRAEERAAEEKAERERQAREREDRRAASPSEHTTGEADPAAASDTQPGNHSVEADTPEEGDPQPPASV